LKSGTVIRDETAEVADLSKLTSAQNQIAGGTPYCAKFKIHFLNHLPFNNSRFETKQQSIKVPVCILVLDAMWNGDKLQCIVIVTFTGVKYFSLFSEADRS